jgi:hypothetical protein
MASRLDSTDYRSFIQYALYQSELTGVPFCTWLKDQSLIITGKLIEAGVEGSRDIQSASEAGQSATYFGPDQQQFNSSDISKFIQLAALECPACEEKLPPEHTDAEVAACLIETIGVPIRVSVKSYRGLRSSCGC